MTSVSVVEPPIDFEPPRHDPPAPTLPTVVAPARPMLRPVFEQPVSFALVLVVVVVVGVACWLAGYWAGSYVPPPPG